MEQESIRATKEVKDSSLFYFLPSGKDTSFTIAYWGDDSDDRKQLTDTVHFHSRLSKQIPKLPRFVTGNANALGYSKEPLFLKSTYNSRESKFTLYDRAQRSLECISWVSNAVSVQTWTEGEEFFLKHKTFPFKSDYVTIVEENDRLVSAIQPWITDAENGMLFRLRSPSHKKQAQKSTTGEEWSDTTKQAGQLSLYGLEYSILGLESFLSSIKINEPNAPL